MKIFTCKCGNRLFFENVQCVACGRDVGWCESCREIASLAPLENGLFTCDLCGCSARKCRNYEVEQVCNRFLIAATEGIEPSLCGACDLTATIPDLSVEGNRDRWRRLEQAKRRLLYQLDYLNLPYRSTQFPLSFDFKGNVLPAEGVWRKGELAEHVYTGHSDGKITINIQEADDVEREKLRVDMNEPQRTLIGHFRHEIGHYYWQLLVQGKENEQACVVLFGDHNNPDYSTALADYYSQGPRGDWNTSFISAYATAHPWEDFAETFGLYLDIRSVLHTAEYLHVPLPIIDDDKGIEGYVVAYQNLGVLVNELNRCLGIFDLVPEVIVPPVVEKLKFIHDLLARTANCPADSTPTRSTTADSSASLAAASYT